MLLETFTICTKFGFFKYFWPARVYKAGGAGTAGPIIWPDQYRENDKLTGPIKIFFRRA